MEFLYINLTFIRVCGVCVDPVKLCQVCILLLHFFTIYYLSHLYFSQYMRERYLVFGVRADPADYNLILRMRVNLTAVKSSF